MVSSRPSSSRSRSASGSAASPTIGSARASASPPTARPSGFRHKSRKSSSFSDERARYERRFETHRARRRAHTFRGRAHNSISIKRQRNIFNSIQFNSFSKTTMHDARRAAISEVTRAVARRFAGFRSCRRDSRLETRAREASAHERVHRGCARIKRGVRLKKGAQNLRKKSRTTTTHFATTVAVQTASRRREPDDDASSRGDDAARRGAARARVRGTTTSRARDADAEANARDRGGVDER